MYKNIDAHVLEWVPKWNNIAIVNLKKKLNA